MTHRFVVRWDEQQGFRPGGEDAEAPCEECGKPYRDHQVESSALEKARREIVDSHYTYCQNCIDGLSCDDKPDAAITRLEAAARLAGRLEQAEKIGEFACAETWYELQVFNETRLYKALGKDDARTVLGMWRRIVTLWKERDRLRAEAGKERT